MRERSVFFMILSLMPVQFLPECETAQIDLGLSPFFKNDVNFGNWQLNSQKEQSIKPGYI